MSIKNVNDSAWRARYMGFVNNAESFRFKKYQPLFQKSLPKNEEEVDLKSLKEKQISVTEGNVSPGKSPKISNPFVQ